MLRPSCECGRERMADVKGKLDQNQVDELLRAVSSSCG
jgi:hypothetical protein